MSNIILFYSLKNQKEAKIMSNHKTKILTIVVLSIVSLIPQLKAYAKPCHLCLDDYEMRSAPMIDAYEDLAKRSEDAFAELEAAFDDHTRVDKQAKQRAKQVERQARQAEQRAKQVEKQARQAERRAKRVEKQARQAKQQTKRVERQAQKKERRTQQAQPGRQSEISRFEADILKLVNQERAKGGHCADDYFKPTPALRSQAQLAKAAHQHGLAMSRSKFFSHYGQAGDTPKDRIIDAGYQGNAWGENIAAGQKTPQQVMQEWMDSPGHCRNILNGLFNELGVSFVFDPNSPYKTYWVQAFGRSR